MTPYLSFHLYIPSHPSPSLSRSLQCSPLSACSIYQPRVIETCVPSLSAKRLADCLHFHAEGCDASVAALIVIDWDPSKPSPPFGESRPAVFPVLVRYGPCFCFWKWQRVLHASSTVAFVSTSHLFFYHLPLSISRTLTLALCSSLCLSVSFLASPSSPSPLPPRNLSHKTQLPQSGQAGQGG